MSVINKKPYAETVIDSLSAENQAALAEMLNGAETTIFRSLINNSYAITSSDKGVAHCVLEVKGGVFTGYLAYNDTYCVLFAYDYSQQMKIVKIDVAHDSYSLVNEELSIAEFRSIFVSNEAESAPTIGDLEPLFVNKIDAPSSTTLTDDQIAKITSGCFINGQFLGFKNPVLFPASEFSGVYYGLAIGYTNYGATQIIGYQIYNKTISKRAAGAGGNLDCVAYLNSKQIPAWPSSTGTFVFKSIDGTLTWVAEAVAEG